jgi:hypothetical protein
MRKENRKKKKKRDSPSNRAGGEFWPTWRAGAGAGALCSPNGPAARERRRGQRRSAGPPARERGGGLTALLVTEGKGARPGWSAASSAAVLHRRSGPLAGKGWRSTGGWSGSRWWGKFGLRGLWRPVHGAVAGARGGEAAGEVSGHDRGGKVVPSDRECMAELQP